jgi:acyl-CoA thioester hydrolase
VRFNECDPQGVVFNGNYLNYFDIAVTELWREAVGGWGEMVANDGVDAVVAEATVRYLAPLHADEEIELLATIAKLGESSILIDFAVKRGGEHCAEGQNRYVVIDPQSGAKAPIPDSLREALTPFSS